MRKTPLIIILSGFLLLVVILGGTAVSADTLEDMNIRLPQTFYGTIEVAGQPAQVGIRVEAYGEGVYTDVNLNPVYTHEGGYGGLGMSASKLTVQGTVTPGTPIEFRVGGVVAEVYDVKAQKGWDQSYPYIPGEVTELNLRISTTVTPEATVTSSSYYNEVTVTQTSSAGKSSVPGVSAGVTQVVTQPAQGGATVSAPATSGGSPPEAGMESSGQPSGPAAAETTTSTETGQSVGGDIPSWMFGAVLIIIIVIGGAAYFASRKKEGEKEEQAGDTIVEDKGVPEENIEAEEETGESEEESEETGENI